MSSMPFAAFFVKNNEVEDGRKKRFHYDRIMCERLVIRDIDYEGRQAR